MMREAGFCEEWDGEEAGLGRMGQMGRMGPGTMGPGSWGMGEGGWGSATDCERWSACGRAACGKSVSGRRGVRNAIPSRFQMLKKPQMMMPRQLCKWRLHNLNQTSTMSNHPSGTWTISPTRHVHLHQPVSCISLRIIISRRLSSAIF